VGIWWCDVVCEWGIAGHGEGQLGGMDGIEKGLEGMKVSVTDDMAAITQYKKDP
jgi:hypothetical protein